MSKINPLYLLAFFVLATFLMIYKTTSTQDAIININENNIQKETDGKQIQVLKNHWKDSSVIQKRIEAILTHSTYAGKVVKKEKKRNSYVFELQELDERALDSFSNKILNEYIVIKKMNIQRYSDSNASVFMECSL
jgi:hypothetical protein